MSKKPWTPTGRLALTLALGAALFLLWLLTSFAMRLPVAHAANLTVCLSGPCDYASIQAAVDNAIPGDVIKVAAGVYTGVNSYGGMTQTVYISKSLTIRGGYTTTNGFAEPPDPVANPTTLDAKGQGRVVYIASSTSVTVENLFVTGGNAAGDGGGIYHAGDDLVLSNTVVFSNSAFFSGGGIYNAGGVLAVSNGSVIAHNRTTSSGFGGGIQNGGTLTVTDSTVRDNYASNNGGGIYNDGIATIANAMILSNTMSFVGLGGGGIFNDTGGVMTIDSSTIAYNVTDATPVCAAQGGGIRNGGTLTITNSTISDNSADESGGGMYIAGGAATLTGITISGNNAGSGSSADKHGGGMVVVGGSTLTITNSTISGNSAADDGAGIYVNTATVYLFNVTISDNSAASEAGGIDNYGTVYFKNTIIAGNTANVSDPDCRNLYGWPLTSQGYNLVQTISPGCNISGDTATNITGEYPLLGPLADNGGDTETHALLSGSPAIDAGTCVDAPATDQRGVARPQDMNCDIGAYEVLQTCFATPNDGANVYSSVQQAVDAAPTGGTIKVAGYCSGVQMRGGLTQTVYVSKTVTIRGGYTTTNGFADPPDPAANPTTLDAQGLGRVMVITGTITPTIEGLRITGGDATLLEGGRYDCDAGGGVYVHSATATISNCMVTSNIASTNGPGLGGGVYLTYAEGATLANNTVQGNTASTADWGYGGGLYIEYGAAALVSNTIQSNTASTTVWGYGGGLSLETSPSTLTGNTVISNTASIAAEGSGGGIHIDYGAATLVSNTIQGNTASVDSSGRGGGLHLYDSTITMTGNIVVNNTASSAGDGWGGGVQAVFEECSECVAVFEKNSIQNNIASATNNGWGGGLHIRGGSAAAILLTGNTVVSNTATLNPTAVGRGGGVWIGGFWYKSTFTITWWRAITPPPQAAGCTLRVTSTGQLTGDYCTTPSPTTPTAAGRGCSWMARTPPWPSATRSSLDTQTWASPSQQVTISPSQAHCGTATGPMRAARARSSAAPTCTAIPPLPIPQPGITTSLRARRPSTPGSTRA